MTLDVIGLAGMSSGAPGRSPHLQLTACGVSGFGFSFDSLSPTEKTNELTEAFQELFLPERKFTVLMILKNFFPVLDIIVSRHCASPPWLASAQ